MGTATHQDTRTHLLDVAEHLFAEQGIDATSLRAITSHADANLAAVHYYFGSKEGLLQEVFSRRFDPLNEDRLHQLDACEQAHGASPPPVEEIIEAFIDPALKRFRNRESRDFMKLMGRIHNDPAEMHAMIHARFVEVIHRFLDAFSRTLPHLSHEELLSRFKFLIGAMVMVLTDPMSRENVPSQLAEACCDLITADTPLDHFITFMAAGMQAPSSEPTSKE